MRIDANELILAGLGIAGTLTSGLLSARLVDRREHRTWQRDKRVGLYREVVELAIQIQDEIISQAAVGWPTDGPVIALFNRLYLLNQSAAVVLGRDEVAAARGLWSELNAAMKKAKCGEHEQIFVPFWNRLAEFKELARRDLERV